MRTSNTKTPEQKQVLICQLVLSALSVPLNNKISNFERLATSYTPKDMQFAVQNSEQVKEQILSVSSMLQIQGYPSRASLVSQINLKNMHVIQGCPAIGHLFKLVEFEESPFKIAKDGAEYLNQIINTYPSFVSFVPLIKQTLAVRIL